MVSPVAGLTVGNVLPETLSTHLPPMNIGCWALTWGGLTVRGFSCVAVAIDVPPCWERGMRRTDFPTRSARRQARAVEDWRPPSLRVVTVAPGARAAALSIP